MHKHTKSSRVLLEILVFSVGETMAPEDIPGADWGDKASLSSKKGFVERGRSGRLFEETDPVTEGERVRLRKGLLEPKLAAVGEGW